MVLLTSFQNNGQMRGTIYEITPNTPKRGPTRRIESKMRQLNWCEMPNFEGTTNLNFYMNLIVLFNLNKVAA